jgi:hypothetical protein
MKRSLILTAVVLGGGLALTGCADRYGYGHGYGYRTAYYSSYYQPGWYGWYDGHYGNIYDGYWGRGGYYYYRTHSRDRWRRDDGRHFRAAQAQPSRRYYRYDRAAPPRDWRGGGGRERDDDRGRGRGRGRGHDRD